MPRKIRELIADLKSAGFADRGGKPALLIAAGREVIAISSIRVWQDR
jgi:hypothetical protein